MPKVPGDKGEPVLQCGRRDERIGDVCAGLSPDASGMLRHGSIGAQLGERRQKEVKRRLVDVGARKQLAAGDDGVRNVAVGDGDPACTPEVVDEHVRIDEDVRHDPIPCEKER